MARAYISLQCALPYGFSGVTLAAFRRDNRCFFSRQPVLFFVIIRALGCKGKFFAVKSPIIQKNSVNLYSFYKTHFSLMIRIENLIQLKAFARQDAIVLSLLWIASFVCVMLVPAGAFGNLLALATPFVVAWRLSRFRDQTLGGVISFRRSFAYGVYTFFYASLVFALAQFAYFRFLDHGTFVQMLTESVRLLMPVYEQNGVSKAELMSAVSQMQALTPIEWAFVFMMQNMLIGVVASMPIAAVCKRNK